MRIGPRRAQRPDAHRCLKADFMKSLLVLLERPLPFCRNSIWEIFARGTNGLTDEATLRLKSRGQCLLRAGRDGACLAARANSIRDVVVNRGSEQTFAMTMGSWPAKAPRRGAAHLATNGIAQQAVHLVYYRDRSPHGRDFG